MTMFDVSATAATRRRDFRGSVILNMNDAMVKATASVMPYFVAPPLSRRSLL